MNDLNVLRPTIRPEHAEAWAGVELFVALTVGFRG